LASGQARGKSGLFLLIFFCNPIPRLTSIFRSQRSDSLETLLTLLLLMHSCYTDILTISSLLAFHCAAIFSGQSKTNPYDPRRHLDYLSFCTLARIRQLSTHGLVYVELGYTLLPRPPILRKHDIQYSRPFPTRTRFVYTSTEIGVG